ncbi:MAG TPA: hypothetical protein VGM36_11850 [Rhizomicrobium sp.]|jgi:hypothetical protein
MSATGTSKPEVQVLPSGAEVIAANSYPAVMRSFEATQFLAHLKSDETAKRSEKAMAYSRDTMREAVEDYVRLLDEASRAMDARALFAQAHEIRGIAAIAGLGVAGRMANGLCLYLDALDGGAPDKSTVRLHVEAIQRVVRGEDEGAIANVVAEELTSLVIRKLGEARALGLPG